MMIHLAANEPEDCSPSARLHCDEERVWHQGDGAMDPKVLEIAIKAHLKEMSGRLDEAAESQSLPTHAPKLAICRRRSRSRSTWSRSSTK
jgi:hypothetical protein